jgi:NADH:ubiquinone oxidoreductase subunit D
LIRIREIYESINIVYQVLVTFSNINTKVNQTNNFFSFFNFASQLSYLKLNKFTKFNSMEALIEHFKTFSEGLKTPRGFVYRAVEAPKGEFGVSLISDGTKHPYRCKIRTPAYHHMQLMPRLVQGHFFADLVTVLGSQDIVFGDVDR